MWWEELSLFYKIKFIVLIFAVCCGVIYVLLLLISAMIQNSAKKKPVNNKKQKINENEVQKHFQLEKQYAENKEYTKAHCDCTDLIKPNPQSLDLQ